MSRLESSFHLHGDECGRAAMQIALDFLLQITENARMCLLVPEQKSQKGARTTWRIDDNSYCSWKFFKRIIDDVFVRAKIDDSCRITVYFHEFRSRKVIDDSLHLWKRSKAVPVSNHTSKFNYVDYRALFKRIAPQPAYGSHVLQGTLNLKQAWVC